MYPREILFPHEDMLGAVRLKVAAICAMLDHGEFEGVQFPNSEHYPFMTEYGFDYEDAPSYLNPQTFANIAPSGQLAIAVEKVISSMGQSISNGQLVPVQLGANLEGVVDDKNTWLRLNDVAAWLKARNIAVGKLFDSLREDEQRIFEAAAEAGDAARMQMESSNSDLESGKSVNEYLNSLSEQASLLLRPDDPQWTERMENCVKLIDDIRLVHAEVRAAANVEVPLNARVRGTLLKLIMGMAIDAYAFDPKALRSPVPTQIAGFLDFWEIYVSDDTVRDYLKEAAMTVSYAKLRHLADKPN